MRIAENFKIRITTFDQTNSTFIENESNVGHFTLATAIDKICSKYQPLGYVMRTDNYSMSGVKWINSNFDCIVIMPGRAK